MYMWPCRHCPRNNKGCVVQAELRHELLKIRPAIRTITHGCKIPYEVFAPGTRVEVEFRDPESSYDAFGSLSIQATVMGRSGRKGHKLKLWLDELITADHKTNIASVFPDRLTLLDEPRVRVCRECGCPEGEKNSDKWICDCEFDPDAPAKPEPVW